MDRVKPHQGRRWLAGIGLLAAVCAQAAQPKAGVDDGTEPRIFPNDLPAIRWVVIEENAARAESANGRINCAKFVLSQSLVARHLTRASRIGEHDFKHMIAWLPCYAGGRVGFADGQAAYWSIREDGAASLHFDNGQERFFYCPQCRLPKTNSWQFN